MGAIMNENIKYYKLGKQYARRTFEDPLWEDIPAMDYEQRAAFNKGYDDALEASGLLPAMFVAALFIIVVLAIVGFVR